MMMMIEAMILENIELEPKLPPMLKAKVKEKSPAKKLKSSPKRPNFSLRFYFYLTSFLLV